MGFPARVSAVAQPWHMSSLHLKPFLVCWGFFFQKNRLQVFVSTYLSASQTLGLTSLLSLVPFEHQYVMTRIS